MVKFERIAYKSNKPTLRKKQVESIEGFLFTSPVILGILIFTVWPVLQSFYYSFTKFNVLQAPQWIGLNNFYNLFKDSDFFHSFIITVIYTVVSVPLGLIIGFLLALLLLRPIPGVGFFRALFYMPVVVPVVALGILWKQIYSPDFGIANILLNVIGLPSYSWFSRPESIMPSLILMGLWQAGSSMIIWLAGLQGVPAHLYEAAIVDGASPVRRFWHITIPMVTPVIFFNLIMGMITALQVFAIAIVTTSGTADGGTSGGPLNASNFLVVMIYNKAFTSLQMGYASAIAWVLFVMIMILTALIFRSSRSWVHYEGEAK